MANVHTTNITEVERLVTRLEIDGFSTVSTMANDDCIRSKCTVDGYEWEICVYPARTASTPDSKPWVALQLILLSEARMPVVRATLSCWVLDPDSRHPYGEKKEKLSHRVEVEGIEAAVFKAMLHFIYTDTVPELDRGQEAVAALAQHLLAATDRYGLDRLKMICENKLSASLTVDMAATTLALAERHNCSQLKVSCIEFIVSTPAVLDAVLATEGYKDLAASCPSLLAELLKAARGRKN